MACQVLTNSNRLLYNRAMKRAVRAEAMDCPQCETRCKRFGKHRNGLQRYRCNHCRKTYTEEHKRPLGAMTVPLGKATLALQLLIEGTSVRSTERITGLHRDTILRLLVVAGERCEKALGRIIVKGGAKLGHCGGVKVDHLRRDDSLSKAARRWGIRRRKSACGNPCSAGDGSFRRSSPRYGHGG